MAISDRLSTSVRVAAVIAVTLITNCLPAVALEEMPQSRASVEPASAGQPSQSESSVQKAHVELDVRPPDPILEKINVLSTIAADKDEQVLRARVMRARYKNKTAMFKQRANDALNSVFMFKGVSLSSEAGDVILDEKLKIDSLGAANYYKQKVEDTLELRVIAAFMQTAAVVGDTKSTPEQVHQSEKGLADLVGPEEAHKAVVDLQSMVVQAPVEFTASDINVLGDMKKAQIALTYAAHKDPIVDEIKDDVHSFNQHSSLIYGAHRMLRIALSITSLAPNMVGPASQAALFGYVVLTGGSEQSKVFKELYMDKRLDCRATTLREEVHLSLDNYKSGQLTKNSLLMACSQGLLARLTNPVMAADLLRPDSLATTSDASKTTAAKTDDVGVTESKAKDVADKGSAAPNDASKTDAAAAVGSAKADELARTSDRDSSSDEDSMHAESGRVVEMKTEASLQDNQD